MPLPHVPEGLMSVLTLPSLKLPGWEWKRESTPLEGSGLFIPRDTLVCPACVKKEKRPTLKVVGGSSDKEDESPTHEE